MMMVSQLKRLLVTLLLISQSSWAANCPGRFHQLPLPENIHSCQVFMESLPASMSFHVAEKPQVIGKFYTEQGLAIRTVRLMKTRIVIDINNAQYSVIISPDHLGSQVDLLARF